MTCQLFLDTASIEEIRNWTRLGLVDGVTTNPALLARESGDPLKNLIAIAEFVDGPVSAQVTSGDSSGMVAQGLKLASLSPNIVVKIPATREGLEAAIDLKAAGVSINVTLGFDPAQIVPFARVGADFFSLILGRVEDFGVHSASTVSDARRILDGLQSETRLLVASIRNPLHLKQAIGGGADLITVPPSTWVSLLSNPTSAKGLEDFQSSWENIPLDLRHRYDSFEIGGVE